MLISYTQNVYWKAHISFFHSLLSLNLNTETHIKLQSPFCYSFTGEYSYFFLLEYLVYNKHISE